jgi:hypothetical protein
MLDPESEQIREVFALYGRAMFQAQCVERQIALLLASCYDSENINEWIYEDRLSDYFSDTLGRLAQTFARSARDEHRALAETTCEIVQDRNWLAHLYFWDRSVEFNLNPS